MTRHRGRSFPRTQGLLFLVAVVIPCLVSGLLALRIVTQEQELAEKRTADERRQALNSVRESLLLRIDRLRLESVTSPGLSADGPIALVASVVNGQFVLPWESGSGESASRLLDEPSFRTRIAKAESLELVDQRYAEAAAAYGMAAAGATDATQRASASLQAARCYVKAGQSERALPLLRAVLPMPAGVVDDQGIPFTLYAARVIASIAGSEPADHDLVAGAIGRALAEPSASLEATYMARDLLQRSHDQDPLSGIAMRRIRDLEQAQQLRESLPALAISSGRTSESPKWTFFGPEDNRWLVTVSHDEAAGSRLIALRSAVVLEAVEPGAVIRAGEGDSLAPDFQGLSVVWSEARLDAFAAGTNTRQAFFIAALTVVVGVALCGAYLSWRAVQRELELAQMRSQFVSSVSHELKTPLTSIRMFAETLSTFSSQCGDAA